MPTAHPCCSNPSMRSAVKRDWLRTVAIVSLCVFATGCNKLSLDARSLIAGTNAKPNQVVKSVNSESTTSISKPAGTTSSISTFDGNVSSPGKIYEKSARCRYLQAQAGIQKSILHTPTLSSEIDNDGDSSVSISYDVVDIRRARLKQEMAEARCRHHLASTKLVQMLITSSQSLTQAGYLAKADSLQESSAGFEQIRRQVRGALSDGSLTFVQAANLRQYITKIKSYEASARGQAVRREAIGGIQNRNTFEVDKKLVSAQREIEQIQSRIRTADQVTVSVSGGYNQTNRDRLHYTRNDNDDLYGNVKVSMRLGAISPSRHEWEDIAEQARVDGLYETDSGLLWRSTDLARIHDKTMKNLYEQQRQIRIALAEARKNSRLSFSTLQTELMAPKLRAQIDVLALKAELAGLNATIADSQRLKRKLRFQ